MLGGNVISVDRSYTATAICAEFDYIIYGNGEKQICCTVDGCNGSIAISSSLILTLAITTVASLIKVTMVG